MSIKFIVTGGAGFIGSSLVERLLADGHHVTAIDNFSTGQRRFLESALAHPSFKLFEIDLLNLDALKQAFAGGELVFHLCRPRCSCGDSHRSGLRKAGN